MYTRLQAIPLSRAKTAWGLLQDVKRALLADPKRARMGCYVGHVPPDDGGPKCGTVGCFAGWVALLAGRHERFIDDDRPARDILGPAELMNYQTVPDSDHSYVFNDGHGDRCYDTTPGTRAHARAVVARINRFMRINAGALKARKLSPRKRRPA